MQEASFQVEFNARNKSPIHDWNFTKMLFNHDFAKALWPEVIDGVEYKAYLLNEPKRTKRWIWQHHLQQMVIADDPIKYLGEHL